MIVGGSSTIGFIDKESEKMIALFKCEGDVKQIAVTPDGDKVIFVSMKKPKLANVYVLNL